MSIGGTPDRVNASGSLIVVNRKTSKFGAGWWLVGLERLYSAKGAAPTSSDTTLLWVGGDGGTRRFRAVAAHTWVGDTVDVGVKLRELTEKSGKGGGLEEKERVQVFNGVVIARQGHGSRETFTTPPFSRTIP